MVSHSLLLQSCLFLYRLHSADDNLHHTGIVSGVTGAAGNLGGVIFSIILRYNGLHYGRVFWIIGAITIGVNVAVSWIRPISKTQIGGR